MADSNALRMQRSRRHKRGDHTLCKIGRCAEAGQVASVDTAGLRAGVEAVFANDQLRLEQARDLVRLIAGGGSSAVSAHGRLDKMITAARAPQSAGGGHYLAGGGPVTIDSELVARVEELIDLEFERAFRGVAARAGQVGWEAAVEEWRREHRAREASRRAADARAQRFGVRREVS